MDVRLFVAHSKPDAKQIALGRETLIGRSPDCNLRIASGQVSRRHCIIKVADDRVCVRDLGSANGTRLNGQTITAEVDVAVPPGSTLVVGPLKFIVQFNAPRIDEDTELLARSDSAGSADLHDVQQMATAPVAEGEETKDYPPSRVRKRGDAPPVVVAESGPQPVAEGGPGPHRQARTTEAEFEAVSNETVFDGLLEGDDPGAAGGGKGPQVGEGTDLFFEEDDLQQLAATIEAADEPPAAGPPAGPAATSGTSVPSDPSKPQTGWRLLDMLRRKKKPDDPPSAPGAAPADDADEALRNFLKDQ
jgi:pSer/pThr/pTyr-binding forkhead associated (FHA) protein